LYKNLLFYSKNVIRDWVICSGDSWVSQNATGKIAEWERGRGLKGLKGLKGFGFVEL